MAIVQTHTLSEEDLVDDADLDSLIREAIVQVYLLVQQRFQFTDQSCM